MGTTAPHNYTSAMNDCLQFPKDIAAAIETFNRGLKYMQEGVDRLAALNNPAPNGYKNLIDFIGSEAAANPDDAEWQRVLAMRDKMVADYAAELTRLKAKLDAANAA